MNKTVLKTAIILVLFSLSGFTDIETAKADVDISGQRVDFAPPINSITPDIVSKQGVFTAVSRQAVF